MVGNLKNFLAGRANGTLVSGIVGKLENQSACRADIGVPALIWHHFRHGSKMLHTGSDCKLCSRAVGEFRGLNSRSYVATKGG